MVACETFSRIGIIILIFQCAQLFPSDQPGMTRDSTALKDELRTMYFKAAEEEKHPLELIQIIEDILKLEPRSAIFWYYRGEQFQLMQDYENAIRSYEPCLELYRVSGTKPMIQVFDNLGYCYLMQEENLKALKVYDSAMVYYPIHPLIKGRKAVSSYAAGRTRAAGRLLGEYRDYWLHVGKNESDILYNMGLLFLDLDNGRAERYFREALETDPGDIDKQASLARVMITSGIKVDEAIVILETAMESEPDNPEILHLCGWGYLRLEDYSRAREYLLRADSLYEGYHHNLELQLEQTERVLRHKLF